MKINVVDPKIKTPDEKAWDNNPGGCFSIPAVLF